MQKILETTEIIHTHRTIETKDIDGTDFCLFTDTKTIKNNKERKTVTVTGVTLKEYVEKIEGMEYICCNIPAPKMYRETAVVVAISNEDYETLMKGKKHITDVVKYLDEIVFDESKYKLVLWNSGSHKIADLNYKFISIPIRMGYIDGRVTNEYYQLDKLLEKLKVDTNVLDRESLEITLIPWYNRDEDSTESIEFKYLLPTEIYEKIVNKDMFEKYEYIMTNVIQASDCLK